MSQATLPSSDQVVPSGNWFYSELFRCYLLKVRWWPLVALGGYVGASLFISGISFFLLVTGGEEVEGFKASPLFHWPLYLWFGRWPW